MTGGAPLAPVLDRRGVRAAQPADVRVVLEDTLRLDSGYSVPGTPSRHGRTTLFTDNFWNARHVCTVADSSGRVSVVAACSSAGHRFDL